MASGAGIRYRDETVGDRDGNGVLWARMESRPGVGRPVFGNVHSLRQRRVMRRLLCQVCAGPPDRNDDGVLWVLPDYRDDWPGWPDGMATYDAPVCLPCARISARVCPGLRGRMVCVRSKCHPVVGVRGALHVVGALGMVAMEDIIVAFDDPAVRWVVAQHLVRQLGECVVASGNVLGCSGD
ncbi:hypothetical protein [Actinokineospora sp. UTMC 2448]|uniref:hypothetical protein n=1 Tax=Actinokineospora sp. UTMC 2448 TaxID=2268449 RepID=UPI002164D14A|nr:hypothetical protein [Actinokineospora sp. UTMC 2448]